MKIKNKFIIIAILVLIGVLLIVGIKPLNNSNITSNNSNAQIDENIEGEYTGYQLILTASYGGYGVNGPLGSGIITKKYNISNNDIFYEPSMGGIWELKKFSTNSNSPHKILKINEIGNKNIELEYEDKKHIVNYDEEISIPSTITIYDGVNYLYTIKISKNN